MIKPIRQMFVFTKHFWLPLTLLLLVTIAILSLYPLPKMAPMPGKDKTHHFIAYAALVFPVALAKPKYWLWVILGILSFSGIIELIQPYVNRYGEWLDLAANAGGVVSGVIAAKLIAAFILQTEQTNQK